MLAVAAASRFLGRRIFGAAETPDGAPERKGVVTEKYVPTSCLNCATRCATRVRVVNGKAVKITGNPLSMVTEGQNCARAHVGVQVLYDPARLTAPMIEDERRQGPRHRPAAGRLFPGKRRCMRSPGACNHSESRAGRSGCCCFTG